MKYEKPEIMSVHSALVVVQSGMKGSAMLYDNLPLQTIGAYEADE